MIHRVRYSGGNQTLYHVPRDRHGRARIPASANYLIVRLWKHEDDAEREVQASAAATIDSASTTLSASAGPSQANPRLLAVASSVGFTPGRHYLLSQGELSEVVVCEAVDTSQVLVRHELRYDYTTSADLDGVEITGTFPSAAAADEEDMEAGGGPYGLIWEYTLATIPYYPLEEVWVTRYTASPLITTADLLRKWPMANRMANERWNLEDAIAAASVDFMADLEASGRDPHYLKHAPTTMACVADKALEYLRRWEQTDEGTIHADMLRQDYDRRIRDLTTGGTPERTAEVRQSTGTSVQGGSLEYGEPLIRRS